MTNPLENGEEDSENALEPRTIRQKLEKFDENLRALDEALGIDLAASSIDISEYLSMSRHQIESLTPEVAARISHEITIASFHIQKTINRNTARLNWCKHSLGEILGICARDYSRIFGWEEKRLTIIADNSVAGKLNHRIMEYQGRVDSLNNLTLSLKDIASSCKNIQFLKTSKDRNY